MGAQHAAGANVLNSYIYNDIIAYNAREAGGGGGFDIWQKCLGFFHSKEFEKPHLNHTINCPK